MDAVKVLDLGTDLLNHVISFLKLKWLVKLDFALRTSELRVEYWTQLPQYKLTLLNDSSWKIHFRQSIDTKRAMNWLLERNIGIRAITLCAAPSAKHQSQNTISQLHKLKLESRCSFDDEMKLISMFPNVEELFCDTESLSLETIKHIKHLRFLKSLHFTLHDPDEQIFCHLCECHSLEALDIMFWPNSLGVEFISALHIILQSKIFAQLKEFAFHDRLNCNFSLPTQDIETWVGRYPKNVHMMKLVGMPVHSLSFLCPNVTSITAAISSASAQAVLQDLAQNLPKLQVIDLTFGQGDEEMELLPFFQHCHNIETLKLSFAKVNMITWIKNIHNWKNLKKLVLDVVSIGEAIALFSALMQQIKLHCPQFEDLTIDDENDNFDELTFEAISMLSNLTSLDLAAQFEICECEVMLPHLATLTRLEQLRLDFYDELDISWLSIQPIIEHCTKLQELYLNVCILTNDLVKCIEINLKNSLVNVKLVDRGVEPFRKKNLQCKVIISFLMNMLKLRYFELEVRRGFNLEKLENLLEENHKEGRIRSNIDISLSIDDF